ncbi:hypothetical protein [Pantoea agglomerans]|uniref:hypothetical protein n=1 Tax=Enterobacter agglomerans TaxID=549 RepID=UPI002B1DA81B|nr:hypothetical protein [Pantoea agglomerans]
MSNAPAPVLFCYMPAHTRLRMCRRFPGRQDAVLLPAGLRSNSRLNTQPHATIDGGSTPADTGMAGICHH